MVENNIEQLIPRSGDGLLKNLAELAEEYRKGNIQCLMLCFRRRKEENIRTYFVGANDPHMFKTLVRLEHDMLGIFADNITNIIEYLD